MPPSRPGRSPVLLILAALAVAILVGLNVMSAQFRPKSDEELQKEAQDKAAAQASPSPSPPPGAGGGQGLAFLSPGGTLGDPKAPQEVVVAFEWTPQVQADPAKVYDAVAVLQKSLPPMAHVRVVDVDVDPSVPEGISVGGHVIVPAAPDGGIALPPPAVGQLMGALMAASRRSPGPAGPPGPPPGAAAAVPPPTAK